MSSDELYEKAKIIAGATGRSVADVFEDLSDDGILNDSNKNKVDLITQLKDAADLISSVQKINAQVSENTVLNGGDNKTEVTVETTLDGDIVDRAIASVQRKAENIKKIAIIFIPVVLLITGGTMEGLGVFDGSDAPPDAPFMNEYGGCLAPDAVNYDEMASWDDGSCYWDDWNEEQCEPNLEEGGSWAESVTGETANIEVHIEVKNLNPDCHIEIEVMVSVYLNNSYQFTMETDELGRYWVYDSVDVKIRDERIDNLGDGDWSFETRFIPVGGNEYCCQMTNVVTIEESKPE
tara:strand:+ start:540 stop:1418 length:879 start_codon:yes stop_codon:yes gene_type:complete